MTQEKGGWIYFVDAVRSLYFPQSKGRATLVCYTSIGNLFVHRTDPLGQQPSARLHSKGMT